MLLRVEKLKKDLGTVQLLQGINFSLDAGEIMAVVGTHSISKTTLIRVLAGLSPISKGEVLVNGLPVSRPESHRTLGYMPKRFGLYRRTTVWEFLEFFAAAYRVPRQRRHGVMEDMLRLVDLWEARNEWMRALSEEEQLRLAFGRILLHNPSLLLLDEPLSAFGAQGLDQFMAIVQELKTMGKAILFTCPDPDVLEGFADVIGVLHRGWLIDVGPAPTVLENLKIHGWPPPRPAPRFRTPPPRVPTAWPAPPHPQDALVQPPPADPAQAAEEGSAPPVTWNSGEDREEEGLGADGNPPETDASPASGDDRKPVAEDVPPPDPDSKLPPEVEEG